MSEHVTGQHVYAGMQVNHSPPWEAWRVRQVGYYPSCSLPMRIGRAGAVKTDCFVALVISTETQSGMFLSRLRLLCRPAPLSLDYGPAHYWRGLWRQQPKIARADSLHHFNASLLSLFQTVGMALPRYSRVLPHSSTQTRLSLMFSHFWKALAEVTRTLKKLILETW